MKARMTKQGTRADEELLAFQTDQVVESAQLNPIQMQKNMELQSSTHDLGPIKANTHMQNKRMAAAKWSATKDILHRIIHGIILIAQALRIPSDSRKKSADPRRHVPGPRERTAISNSIQSIFRHQWHTRH